MIRGEMQKRLQVKIDRIEKDIAGYKKREDEANQKLEKMRRQGEKNTSVSREIKDLEGLIERLEG